MTNKLGALLTTLVLTIGFIAPSYSYGATPQLRTDLLLPRPQKITVGKGSLRAKGLALNTPVLHEELLDYFTWAGFRQGRYHTLALNVFITDSLSGVKLPSHEAYRLKIDAEGIHIDAVHEDGVYRAIQTLRQLTVPHEPLPYVDILDWPAWSIRGFMQDVGRTYIPMAELKKQIALMASFKINVFHWHLTENQAWRIESKAFPQLTSIAATERMPGKYYTLEEARELVNWCRQHRVLLIPEIDMPGHSAAFERAMGFGMQTPQGKSALKTILAEVAQAMNVPYIHIGTDEVEFTDPTFVPEMVAYVRSLGKKVISWRPGWDYKAGEIDMLQLWSYRGETQSGIPAIDCRLHYINHYDTFADLVALYNAQILRRPHGDAMHQGAILALWNDRYIDSDRQMMADNHAYASVLALAERAWIGGGLGYFDGTTTVLRDRTNTGFKGFADFERRLLYYKRTLLSSEPIPYVRQTNAVWQIVDAFPNGGDFTKVFPPEQSLRALSSDTPPKRLVSYTHEGKIYHAQQVYGSGFYLRHVWGELVPGVYAEPKEYHTAYAMAWVYSPSPQSVGLCLETQNYSRSESDLPPPLGKWDHRESRIYLNGKRLSPPQWTATHTERSHEVPLGNENASNRQPIPVRLRSGWNHIMLALPVGKFSTPETRLVKWMFTAYFTTLDGREAASLRYYHAEQ